MPWILVEKTSGERHTRVFDTAREATEYKRTITGSWRPERLIDDSWTIRERARFVRREYQPLLWHWNERWQAFLHSAESVKVRDVLFPHIDSARPEMICFTENPDKGMNDIKTYMTPGRFLNKYCSPWLSAETIEELANLHRVATKKTTLRFASTPQEIVAVYSMDAGFSSCMQYKPSHWSSRGHPTRVYGAGDLAVGYITRDKTLLARALCWPERKVYGRVYGDASLLTKAFDEAGYRHSTVDFDGARILKEIFREDGRDYYVIPYIDYSYMVLPGKDYLTITTSSRGLGCHSTGALVGVPPRCAICDSDIGTEVVYMSASDYSSSRRTYCCTAHQHETFLDSYTGHLFHNSVDRTAYHDDESGFSIRYVVTEFLNRMTDRYVIQAVGLDNTISNYHRDLVTRMADGTYWTISKFHRDGFRCAYDRKRYPISERIEQKGRFIARRNQLADSWDKKDIFVLNTNSTWKVKQNVRLYSFQSAVDELRAIPIDNA